MLSGSLNQRANLRQDAGESLSPKSVCGASRDRTPHHLCLSADMIVQEAEWLLSTGITEAQEDPDALASSVLGLCVLDGPGEQAGKSRHGFLDTGVHFRYRAAAGIC